MTGNRRRQRGQALVEFTLLLPILIIIIFGIIEWGRIWMTVHTIAGAAREGARIAAITAPDPTQVQNAVQNVLAASNIAGAVITTSGPNANDEVTVTVSVNHNVVTGAIIPGLNGTINLTRSAVMHWEG